MKRCPHCKTQDNEDAIICKNCMRYFNAPVEAAAVAAAQTAKGAATQVAHDAETKKRTGSKSGLVSLVRLLVFAGILVYGIGWRTVEQWIWPTPDENVPVATPETPAASEPAPTPVREAAPAPAREPVTAPPPEPAPAPTRDPAPAPAGAPAGEPGTRGAQTALREAAAQPASPGGATKAPRRPQPPASTPPPEPAPPPARAEAPPVPVPVVEPPPAPPKPNPVPQPTRVGGDIKAPRKVRDAAPEYPAAAQRARVEGIVIIEATIDPRGRVQQARVLRSIPLLDEAALDAVKQWEYEPTLVNGVATPVIMTVTVRFSLR